MKTPFEQQNTRQLRRDTLSDLRGYLTDPVLWTIAAALTAALIIVDPLKWAVLP